MTNRALKTQGNIALALVAALALAVVVNYLGAKYYTQWDWTETRINTLSSRTTNVLRGLDQDVRLVSFLSEGSQVSPDALDQLQRMLDAYRAVNPARISIDTLSAARDPVQVQALLQEFDLSPWDAIDIVIVESGNRRKQVRLEEMVELDYGQGLGGPPVVKSLTAESALTAAIVAVTRGSKPVVAFASGHGEREVRVADGSGLLRLVEALEREDVEVRSWPALGSDAVPDGTSLVIVAAPSQPWMEIERGALARYLDGGGSVVLLLDPIPQRAGDGELVPSGLEPLLEAWGLRADPDIVVDPTHAIRSPAAFFVELGGGHPVTESIAGQPLILQIARSFSIAEEQPPGVRIETLIESSGDGFGETDLASLFAGRLEQSTDDRAGPVPLFVLAEREARSNGGDTTADGTGDAAEAEQPADDEADRSPPLDTHGPRLVAGGDVDVLSNASIDNPGNRGFALNLIAYLVEQQQAVGIPPKDRNLSRLFLRSDQLLWLFPLLAVLLPIAAIGAGIGLWLRRRQA